jgi:hypothetical protein
MSTGKVKWFNDQRRDSNPLKKGMRLNSKPHRVLKALKPQT